MSARDRLPEILEMRAKRMSLQEIGDEIGVTRERIRQLIPGTGRLAGTWAEDELKQAQNMRKEELSVQQISKDTGRSNNSVRYHLHKLGISVRTTNALLFEQGLRRCAGECHKILPIIKFGPCHGYPQNLNNRCIECNRKQAHRSYLKTHPDAVPYTEYGRGLQRLKRRRP